jgi:uncharacterized protein YecE (DUF72 family)
MELSRSAADVRVGCSGWQYKHWKGDFYPSNLPVSGWFQQYARTFDTVEINNSFYRWPEAEMFARWREQAPKGFVYAVKASRFLTHMKKLKDPQEPLVRTFDNVRELGSRLGPVLYQLPPRWPVNVARFEEFLQTLRGLGDGHRATGRYHVVEFREPSWYTEEIYALLQKYKVALCVHDMHGSATGRMAIGPFIYVRFHFGTQKYGGRYEDERLDEWADWLAQSARRGLPVFAYFNNDVGGHAPRDAVRLRDRIMARLMPKVSRAIRG